MRTPQDYKKVSLCLAQSKMAPHRMVTGRQLLLSKQNSSSSIMQGACLPSSRKVSNHCSRQALMQAYRLDEKQTACIALTSRLDLKIAGSKACGGKAAQPYAHATIHALHEAQPNESSATFVTMLSSSAGACNSPRIAQIAEAAQSAQLCSASKATRRLCR